MSMDKMSMAERRKWSRDYVERCVDLYGQGFRTATDKEGHFYWYHTNSPETHYPSVAAVEASLMEYRVLQ